MTSQKRNLLKILLPLVVLVVGIAGAMVITRARPRVMTQERKPAPPLVRIFTARAADLRLTVRTNGTVEPRTESTLVPEVSGRVLWVSPGLAAGGFFDEGDPLLRIDPSDYLAAEANARAQVAQAELRLAREKEEAEIARRDWEDLGDGVPSPLTLRGPQVADARAALDAARAVLAKAERDLDRTEVRAPFAGRVRREQVDVGQFVTRGQPVATVYAVDFVEVRLPLPDEELAFVDLPLGYRGSAAPGAGPGASPMPEVILTARFAGREHEWRGHVVRTEGELDPQSRMVHVIAQVEDPYGRRTDRDQPPLAVGLFVEAEILGHTVRDMVVVPRSAIRGRSLVYVIDDNGVLQFREVKILKAERDVVIVGDGLEDGDRVCLSPLDSAVDGMAVRTVDSGMPPELLTLFKPASEMNQEAERVP
jgi:RND family efflux transporter MFP subunit